MAKSLGNRKQPAPGSLSGDRDDPPDSQNTSGSPAAVSVQPFTQVAAKIELGKENALYIRGHGEGLRWDRGLRLACIDSGTWVWAVRRATQPIEFHLLLDDLIWARGDNLVLEPGRVVELRPDFEWPEIPHVVPPTNS